MAEGQQFTETEDSKRNKSQKQVSFYLLYIMYRQLGLGWCQTNQCTDLVITHFLIPASQTLDLVASKQA